MNDGLTPNKYLSKEEREHLELILVRYQSMALRNVTLLLLMLKAGLRPQEVLNLSWADVDFLKARVFVDTIKRGKPRYVPLGPSLLEKLQKLFVLSKSTYGPIFDIGYRQFVHVWHEYRPCGKKLHSLRHTFAVNAYEKSGYNLKTVQQLLGHRNLTTTAVYLDLESNDETLRKAID